MPLSDTGLSSHLLSRACEWHASGSCPDSCGQDPTSCGRWCSAEAPTSAAKSPATPWATLLQDDISVLRSRQPRLSSMPDPELEWGPWADLLTNFPREWSELVAACFSPDSSVAKSRSDPTVGEAAGHTCTQCGAAFFSGKALAQHARIAHGTRSEWHRYIGKTARCLVCRLKFSTRLRAVAHLSDPRHNLRCRAAILDGQVRPLSKAYLSTLEEQARVERAAARAAGGTHPLSRGRPRARHVKYS